MVSSTLNIFLENWFKMAQSSESKQYNIVKWQDFDVDKVSIKSDPYGYILQRLNFSVLYDGQPFYLQTPGGVIANLHCNPATGMICHITGSDDTFKAFTNKLFQLNTKLSETIYQAIIRYPTWLRLCQSHYKDDSFDVSKVIAGFKTGYEPGNNKVFCLVSPETECYDVNKNLTNSFQFRDGQSFAACLLSMNNIQVTLHQGSPFSSPFMVHDDWTIHQSLLNVGVKETKTQSEPVKTPKRVTFLDDEESKPRPKKYQPKTQHPKKNNKAKRKFISGHPNSYQNVKKLRQNHLNAADEIKKINARVDEIQKLLQQEIEGIRNPKSAQLASSSSVPFTSSPSIPHSMASRGNPFRLPTPNSMANLTSTPLIPNSMVSRGSPFRLPTQQIHGAQTSFGN